MEQTLPSVCNHPISFFEAVDGETIPEWKLQPFPVDTTRSSYAVRLTKRLILRKFLKSQDQLLLFLEDDVVVNDGFQKAVQEAIEIDRDLVFLGGMHQSPPEGEGPWSEGVVTRLVGESWEDGVLLSCSIQMNYRWWIPPVPLTVELLEIMCPFIMMRPRTRRGRKEHLQRWRERLGRLASLFSSQVGHFILIAI